MSASPMPSFEALYAFVRDAYLHSRLEGRNAGWPSTPGRSYSEMIVDGYMTDLQTNGVALVSHFESRRGCMVQFDRTLTILNPDAPAEEIKFRAHSLSNPMAGDWA